MAFLRLGTANARRNFARSLFAIISMSLAAGFLTYSISLSRGYVQLFKANTRSMVGGEIVAYARQFGGVIPEGESVWEHSFFQESPFSDLAEFRPELLSSGYLSSVEVQSTFTPDDMQELYQALPGITFVYPRYQIPAATVDMNRRSTPLRGRHPELDNMQAIHPSTQIWRGDEGGRWFNPDESDQMVAVVSMWQELPAGSALPVTGRTIRVEVPRINYVNGEPVFLYAQPIVYEFLIVGVLEVQTRFLDNVPLYWYSPEIHIPLGTWERIWRDIGGGEYLPEQVTLGYTNLSYLEDVVMELRAMFPQFTIFSAAEHFIQAQRRGLIERIPVWLEGTIVIEDTQQAMQLDMRLPFTLMIFMNAALVVASNLLIMVQERKKEIGILKAVGARRSDVVVMVLVEATMISLLGAAFGFIFFRLPALLTQLTNGIGWDIILPGMISDAGLVFGLSALFALVFGFLPGLRTASLSVMEVFRSG
jgi:hypothetical protein